DVPATHWAAETVELAAKKGLMEGTGNGQFGLEKSIDRAAFVTVLCRMFSWEMTPEEIPSFADCGPADWYYGAVETALAHNVIDEGEHFRPTAAISRGEMAEMLVRALGYGPLAGAVAGMPSPFSDVTGNGYVNIAYDVGMTMGIAEEGGVRFHPGDAASREEAAAMMLRVYDRYTQKIDWLHGFYAFDSYKQIHFTKEMDGVSVGWARLDYDPVTGAFLNNTNLNGNDWREPKDSAVATDFFAQNGTPCNLNVFCGTGDKVTLPDGKETNDVAAIIDTEQSRKIAIDALVAAVNPRFSGITIDFEGLKSADVYKEKFTAFMTELRAALPAEKTLYVCVQPTNWYKGFDFKALGEICDKVILMAHDYRHTFSKDYIGTNKTDNPDSPLPRIYEALRQITDPVSGVQDRSKIALALSFANSALKIDENGLMLENVAYHPARDTVVKRLKQPDTIMGWHEAYGSSFATYSGDKGDKYILWYEDGRSATAKVELARMFGINGISLWRLGSIPDDQTPGLNYDAWSALLSER
ncbi:MAG: S-layer homology domain-containing protein, partial [Oscillospiraceae bacterium]